MTVILSQAMSAANNMDNDYARLKELKSSDNASLKFYEWQKPSLTYGYFTNPNEFLNKHEFDAARRPTGGGVLFHTLDLAFSLLLPPRFVHENTYENYKSVNDVIAKALKELGLETEFKISTSPNSKFCMATPTIYDLLIEGKKCVGAAQRKTKEGLLHQGTIALRVPGESEKAALKDVSLYNEMIKETYPVQVPVLELKQAIERAFLDKYGNS